ncbi:MAG: serine acetyltransferase [Myxococcales bacterium]|nr:serine acetyltransferase [Myxococcales bacterium]
MKQPTNHDDVIEALLAGADACASQQRATACKLPSPAAIERCLQFTRQLFFPRLAADAHGLTDPKPAMQAAIRELREVLVHEVGVAAMMNAAATARAEAMAHAARVVDDLIRGLPELQRRIGLDLVAALGGDPAAANKDEILLCYPGLQAVMVHRIAHALWQAGVPLIPRLMAEISHAKTGIDIHPGAAIGDAFFIDHGTGVVIGETTVIGNSVRIYQGVTLGALSVPVIAADKLVGLSERPRGPKRHPTLGDNVVVYAGATILGGKTLIGSGAVIGGNAWVTSSVPAGATVVGVHGGR